MSMTRLSLATGFFVAHLFFTWLQAKSVIAANCSVCIQCNKNAKGLVMHLEW